MAFLTAEKVTKRFGVWTPYKRSTWKLKNRPSRCIIDLHAPEKPKFFNCVTGFYTPKKAKSTWKATRSSVCRPSESPSEASARTLQNIRLFKNMTAIETSWFGMHPHLRSTMIGGILHSRVPFMKSRVVAEARGCLALSASPGQGDMLPKNLPYARSRRLGDSPGRWPTGPNCCC